MCDADPLLYVTFHGGSKGIDTVEAIDADGKRSHGHVLGHKARAGLDELRGLHFTTDGGLYVCEANKKRSRILRFDAGKAYGYKRKLKRVVAKYKDPTGKMGAMKHPYGLVRAEGGVLYVSSQDSGFVSAYRIDAAGKAHPLATSSYLAGLYPGGNFPDGAFAGCNDPPNGWTAVTVAQGGLGLTTDPNHSVRGLVVAEVDGRPVLYVADEVNDRVAAYDAATGEFLSGLVIGGNGLAGPVGIALHPDGKTAYVGSTGIARPHQPKTPGAVYRFTVGTGGLPTRLGEVKSPSGLAFAGGSLYVASRKKKKIRRWNGVRFERFGKRLNDKPECLIAFQGA